MPVFIPSDISVIFLAAGILLVAARLLGGLARRWGQPRVLGELATGILLGPTVLGALFPDLWQALYPLQGNNAIVFNALMTLSVTLFLLTAGAEVNLSLLLTQGRRAFVIGIIGLALPFTIGFLCVRAAPGFLVSGGNASAQIFAFFFATAMSISALPLIAKTLMDLDLYKSRLGMMIIAAAMFDDLVGWTVFAVVLGAMRVEAGHSATIGYTILLTLAFTLLMLTMGRRLINSLFLWLQTRSGRSGAVLASAIYLTLFGAAFTDWIGLHTVFGAFMVGVAIGDSPHLDADTRKTIDRVASNIFAPLFFAGVGLKANFIENFEWKLVLLVLTVGIVGKVIGCFLGAKLCRVATRESWALGFALNARGMMEIILSALAMQHGLIGKPMFVALVFMAIVTSMMSGPIMQRILNIKEAPAT